MGVGYYSIRQYAVEVPPHVYRGVEPTQGKQVDGATVALYGGGTLVALTLAAVATVAIIKRRRRKQGKPTDFRIWDSPDTHTHPPETLK